MKSNINQFLVVGLTVFLGINIGLLQSVRAAPQVYSRIAIPSAPRPLFNSIPSDLTHLTNADVYPAFWIQGVSPTYSAGGLYNSTAKALELTRFAAIITTDTNVPISACEAVFVFNVHSSLQAAAQNPAYGNVARFVAPINTSNLTLLTGIQTQYNTSEWRLDVPLSMFIPAQTNYFYSFSVISQGWCGSNYVIESPFAPTSVHYLISPELEGGYAALPAMMTIALWGRDTILNVKPAPTADADIATLTDGD